MAINEAKTVTDPTLCSRSWRSRLTLTRSSGALLTRATMAAAARSSHSLIRERTRTVSTSSSLRAGWTRNYDVTTVSAVTAHEARQTHPDGQSSGDMHADDRTAWDCHCRQRGAVGR